MRIYLDETMINNFITYAMQRKIESEKDYRLMPYFTAEKVKMFAEYYIKDKTTYCDNNGNSFVNGEQMSWTPTKISFPKGKVLDNRNDILEYEKECCQTNRADYIEDNLFHILWCEIERILRLEQQKELDDYDKRFLNKVNRYCKSEMQRRKK